MKLLTNIFLTLLCVSVFCTVNAQNNRKPIIEIDDIVLPDHPKALLSAKVYDNDYYEITLRYQPEEASEKDNNDATTEASHSVKYIVRPFTPENFCRILNLAITKLEGQLNKKGKSIYTDSNNTEQDSIAEKPQISKCYQLFYQLKGSEIASSGNKEVPPVAGKLYFSKNLFIQKSTTNEFYKILIKREHDSILAYVRDSIVSRWKATRSAKAWKEDSSTFMTKAVKASIENIADLKKIREDDALFNKIRLKFADKYKALEDCYTRLNENRRRHTEIFNSLIDFRNNIIRSRIKDSIILQEFEEGAISDQTIISKISDTLLLKMMTIDTIIDNISDTNRVKMQNIDNPTKLVLPIDIVSKYRIYNTLDTTLKKYIKLNNDVVLALINIYQEQQTRNRLYKMLTKLDTSASLSLELRKSFEFKIESVEIEFNEGFIENILIVGDVEILDLSKLSLLREKERLSDDIVNNAILNDDFLNEAVTKKRIKFENKFPIGFSRKSDYLNLNGIQLSSYRDENGDTYTLDLRNLLTIYIEKHEVGRRDFSPKNGIVTYDPKVDKTYCKILEKEETSKLFEARIFSDFVGLDGKAANGLIQTEIAKRLNLNTSRWWRNHYWCWGAWIEPTLTLSKIEQNNKNLLLNQVALTNTSEHNKYYAATLDIRQHEALGVGSRFNIFYVDIPKLKSTLSLNGNLNFGRTPVSLLTIDTSMNNGVNTFSMSPEFTLDTKADERWGLLMSFRMNRMNILSREVIQTADVNDPKNLRGIGINDKWYNTAQFQVFFKPSEDNKGQLFFRYRYHWQLGDFKLGFHQAQVGYSFYLLGRNKGVTK